MAKYVLKYWFEHGGTCLWSANDAAKEDFDYAIDNEKLPISKELVRELDLLEKEYHGYLNWEYPPDPLPWSTEQKVDFKNRANMLYLKILSELGSDFEIINDVDRCVI
jgi:hypothetical protein